MNKKMGKLASAIESGDLKRAIYLSQSLLEEGISPKDIISKGLTLGMHALGLRFEKGKAFISDMLTSAMVFEECMDLIKRKLPFVDKKSIGKAIIGTVEGDIHSIGKNLVAVMLETEGFEVINLGEDIPAKKFVNAVKIEGPEVLAISALLSTTAVNMKKVIQELEADGIRNRVKVMIGGAPLDEEFAKRIGADAYGKTAFDAARIARCFISQTG